MKKILLIFILMLTTNVFSQNITVIDNILPNGGNTPNGSATNDNALNHLSWIWSNATYDTLQVGGTTIDSLAKGIYYLIYIDINTNSHTIPFYINDLYLGCDSFKIEIIQVSGGNNCAGELAAQITGGTPPYYYWWTNSSQTIDVYSQTMTNVCSDAYQLYVEDSNHCLNFYQTILNDTIDTTSCVNFSLSTTVVNKYAYDGYCVGEISENVTGVNGSYQNNFFKFENPFYSSTSLNNLCSGIYIYSVSDEVGCYDDVFITILDTIVNNNFPLNLLINTQNVTYPDSCDGNANIEIIGGVSPYFYEGNVLTNNFFYLDSLCQGINSVTVYDSAGDSIISPFLISNNLNTIINIPYPDSLVIDTIYNPISTNCSINFQNIDSASITSINFLSADSIIVTFAVYYNGNQVGFIDESYSFNSGNGVYTIILDLYCPNKALGDFVKIYDQVYYNDNLLGSAWYLMTTNPKIIEASIKIYPIPFSNQIKISLNKVDDYQINLYNIEGKLVFSKAINQSNSIDLDVNNIGKGQYFIKIISNSVVVTKKIIKI